MSELDGMSRLLGNIESSISNLGRRFDRLESRMDERDETLSDIQAVAGAAGDDIRFLKDVISNDIKPVTDDVKRWRLMGMGALAVTGLGAASIGTAMYVAAQHLLPWLRLP